MIKEKVLQATDIDINTKYVYHMYNKNEKRGRVFDEHGTPRGEPEYPPRRNVLLRSSILWPGGKDPFSGKERAKGKHLIRYYDGCTTLFVDEQPREKDIIEQLVSNTREVVLLGGYASVYGYDTMLKMYMDWCSYNVNSPYKVPTVENIFVLLDNDKKAKEEEIRLDKIEEATKMAKDASEKKMMIHAKYLGIPFRDMITGNELSPSAIRTAYRKIAMDDPARFIMSYNDKSIQVATYVQTAMETGEISTNLIPNKAVWRSGQSEICDISGIKSQEGVVAKLVEFSQGEDGGSFYDQLRALYQ